MSPLGARATSFTEFCAHVRDKAPSDSLFLSSFFYNISHDVLLLSPPHRHFSYPVLLWGWPEYRPRLGTVSNLFQTAQFTRPTCASVGVCVRVAFKRDDLCLQLTRDHYCSSFFFFVPSIYLKRKQKGISP